MNKKQKNLVIIAAVILVMAVGIGYSIYNKNKPGDYDTFAQCLKDKGAIFYGAFWCPHCQDQKKEFGNSAKLLPYVECSTADGQSMLISCQQKGIQSYPTWEYPDGSREVGVKTLQELADKTGCSIK
ncbi:MAG: hypothetical protein PHW95_03670 [Patescibacteria group bacterium]|nr:hypothetical protein [Patescibacteria group bacterium]